MRVELRHTGIEPSLMDLKNLQMNRWAETTVDFGDQSENAADEIRYLLATGADLLVDDVLLFEAARK